MVRCQSEYCDVRPADSLRRKSSDRKGLHVLRGPEHVIYVHGLFMRGHESLLLRSRLGREHGFKTHTFHYGSMSAGMQEITDRLQAFVSTLGQIGGLHFVGHSLGGLVIY